MDSENEIFNYITICSKKIGRSKYESNELAQIVCLKYLESPELFNKAYSIKRYIYFVVRNSLKELHLDTYSLETDVEDIIEDINPIDNIKILDDMLYELTEIERLWITTYIDCDFNHSEIERRTGITRQCTKKRINKILDKWKHLDIYLH